MRSIIIAATATATLFATPALTQQPSKGTGIPDFSGTWGHPYLAGFEMPLSGPGPLVNESRVPQIFDMDGRPIAPATNATFVSSQYQSVGDYTNSILKPWAAEIVKKFGEVELSGVASPTPSNQCWPELCPIFFVVSQCR
jgi:hypothetical protein